VVEGSSVVVWFSAPGFRQLAVADVNGELVVDVETTLVRVGCRSCGVPARPKDRRWVSVRDAPAGDRPVVLRWRKRVWACDDPDCGEKTWTEQRPDFLVPRHALTVRAQRWVFNRVRPVQGTPASCARALGVSWWTAMAAVRWFGQPLVDDPDRVGITAQVGFDETVMSPARHLRRRRFITATVDVQSGQIIDVFNGRDASDLRKWLQGQPVWWRDGIEVVSMDPHEGYRSAIKASTELIGEVMIVVDPFHIVRLANAAVTKCRQRVQQTTLHHRGWTNDPLYDIRKLLLMGAERLDDKAWARIHEGLRYGDPHDVVQAAWCAREFVRDVYITEDPDEAVVALDKALEWCTDPEASSELVTLAKTLTRWRTEILNHHTTGASNGKTEAANLTIKSVKRSGRGFRNLANYRLRILLAAGLQRETQTVTRLRARPRLIA
jgi:transposase